MQYGQACTDPAGTPHQNCFVSDGGMILFDVVNPADLVYAQAFSADEFKTPQGPVDQIPREVFLPGAFTTIYGPDSVGSYYGEANPMITDDSGNLVPLFASPLPAHRLGDSPQFPADMSMINETRMYYERYDSSLWQFYLKGTARGTVYLAAVYVIGVVAAAAAAAAAAGSAGGAAAGAAATSEVAAGTVAEVATTEVAAGTVAADTTATVVAETVIPAEIVAPTVVEVAPVVDTAALAAPETVIPAATVEPVVAAETIAPATITPVVSEPIAAASETVASVDASAITAPATIDSSSLAVDPALISEPPIDAPYDPALISEPPAPVSSPAAPAPGATLASTAGNITTVSGAVAAGKALYNSVVSARNPGARQPSMTTQSTVASQPGAGGVPDSGGLALDYAPALRALLVPGVILLAAIKLAL